MQQLELIVGLKIMVISDTNSERIMNLIQKVLIHVLGIAGDHEIDPFSLQPISVSPSIPLSRQEAVVL
ncbi:uncharacterized protein METZ01_LOCUS84799 [marine metagenome]|uniref:Uncharacterized protein n=1 Tax=marine metagenome TaxID=408172 RepID=A0A381UUX8_9ZZZZ